MKKVQILIFVLIFIIVTGCNTTKNTKAVKLSENEKVVNNEKLALKSANGKKEFKKLKKKLYSKDPNIQTAAAVSLLNLQYSDAFELLLGILKDAKKEKLTISVLKAFGFNGDDRILEETLALLDNKNENIRLAAAETLGNLRSFKAHKLMISNLIDSQRSIEFRILVAQALGDVRNRDSVEHLIKGLQSKDKKLKKAAHNALIKITGQPIGDDVNQWKKWWDQNKVKTREEWLEEIVQHLEENIKQVETENKILNKEIAQKSISLLELYSKNNGNDRIFVEAAKSKYADVRIFAAKELARRKPPEAKDIFSELLLDENLEVKIVAARTLGEIADESTLEPLLDAVNDKNVDVQVAVIKALGLVEMPQAVNALIVLLKSEDPKVKRAAIEALGQIGDSEVAFSINPFFKDSDPSVREAVAIALGKIKNINSVDPLIRALLDKEERVRWYAADSLGKLKAEKAVDPLINLLSDSSARVRESATASLGQIGNEKSFEHLVKLLNDPDERVVEQASDVLLTIAGDKLEALDNLADVFLIKKDYDRAIKVTKKQLAKYSENEEALWNSRKRLAKSFAFTGRWDKAVDLYTMLVEYFSDDIELKKELLRSMVEMKQYERALDFLSKWLKGPYNNKEFFWKSRLDITAIIFSNGDYEKVKVLVDKFESENSELGGNDLKSDFRSLRERSLDKIKENDLSYKNKDGAGCTQMSNNWLVGSIEYVSYSVEMS